MEIADMKMTLKMAAIAAVAVGTLVSLSTNKAEARRLYVGPHFAASAVYHFSPDLPWYAVRTYYMGGPWSGPYYHWNGWSDYAAQNGIGCTPGTPVKGGDGIWYNCQ
jgi:hypothetical protein